MLFTFSSLPKITRESIYCPWLCTEKHSSKSKGERQTGEELIREPVNVLKGATERQQFNPVFALCIFWMLKLEALSVEKTFSQSEIIFPPPPPPPTNDVNAKCTYLLCRWSDWFATKPKKQTLLFKMMYACAKSKQKTTGRHIRR